MMRKILTAPIFAAYWVLAMCAGALLFPMLWDAMWGTNFALLPHALALGVLAGMGIEVSPDNQTMTVVAVGVALGAAAALVWWLTNSLGETPLIRATKAQDYDAVKALLAAPGAKVDGSSWDGSTSLYRAACVGNIDIAKLLLDAGADPERANSDGFTPLLVAVGRGPELVRLLLDHGAEPWDALFRGVAQGDDPDALETLRLLLDKGVDINAKGLASLGLAESAEGMTPLMVAAAHNWSEGVRFLLDNGADPALSSNMGTALDIARSRNAEDCVAVLEPYADTSEPTEML